MQLTKYLVTDKVFADCSKRQDVQLLNIFLRIKKVPEPLTSKAIYYKRKGICVSHCLGNISI